MCGIFAVINLENRSGTIEFNRAEIAANFVESRGPDAQGTWFDKKCYFYHSRLRIVDQSIKSDQPMVDSTGRYVIVFNGEIYNYIAIKNELVSLGYSFCTESDTEVLLYSLIHWGTDAIKKLNGIFAFCFYDTFNSSVIISRDRVGVKPLYYKIRNGQLVVSSLPYAIIYYSNNPISISFTQLCSQLFFRTTLNGRSLVNDIQMMEPGYCLKLNANGSSIKLDMNSSLSLFSKGKVVGFDPNVISESVKNQIPSNSSFAALLSGGVDSSIIAYELQQHARGKFELYTAKVRGSSYDESCYAELVSKRLGKNLNLIPIDIGGDFKQIETATLSRQLPLAMHNELAMVQLSKEISKKYKVAFSGEGADELFAGYSRLFGLGFDFNRRKISDRMIFSNKVNDTLKINDIDPNDLLLSIFNRYFYFPRTELKNLLHPELQKEFDFALEEIYQFFVELCSYTKSQCAFELVSQIMLKFHLPALLQMIDGNSMPYGVEMRVPFTSPQVLEMAMSLSKNQKLRWNSQWDFFKSCLQPMSKVSEIRNTAKYCLKKHYQGKIPESVLFRPKMGFPTPMGEWADSDYAQEVCDQISSGRSRLNEWIDKKKFINWKNSNKNFDDKYGKKLWMLVGLEVYLNQINNLSTGKYIGTSIR